MYYPTSHFRLILIAEKDKVYEKFPIPLINRLEKHIVTTATILSESDQQDILKMLQIWKDNFTQVESLLVLHSVSQHFCI